MSAGSIYIILVVMVQLLSVAFGVPRGDIVSGHLFVDTANEQVG